MSEYFPLYLMENSIFQPKNWLGQQHYVYQTIQRRNISSNSRFVEFRLNFQMSLAEIKNIHSPKIYKLSTEHSYFAIFRHFKLIYHRCKALGTQFKPNLPTGLFLRKKILFFYELDSVEIWPICDIQSIADYGKWQFSLFSNLSYFYQEIF